MMQNVVTSVLHDAGVVIKDTERIWKHYLRGWFTADSLGSLPLEPFAYIFFNASFVPLFRLHRFMRFSRLGKYFSSIETILQVSATSPSPSPSLSLLQHQHEEGEG